MTEVQFAKQFLTTLDSKPAKYQSDHVFDPETFQIRLPYTLPKLLHPPHPLPTKPHGTSASAPPGSVPTASTINVTLKSSRNPTFTLHLPSLPSTTPITSLRTQVQSLLSQSQPTPVTAEKIKILQNKKPIPASKSTINDVLPDTNGKAELELGVLVMGGATDPNPTTQTINLNNDIEPSPKEVGPESEKAAALAAEQTSTGGTNGKAEPSLKKVKSPEPVRPGEISGRDVLGTQEFWDDLQGFLEQRLRSSEVAQEVRQVFEKAIR